MPKSIFIVLALLASVPASATSLHNSEAIEVRHLEQLGRIWIYLDLFDPYLSSHHADWDSALGEAIGAARRAHNDADFMAAINAMLARSGDPAAEARPLQGEESPTASAATVPAVRVENDIAIGDCNAMAQAAAQSSVSNVVLQLYQAGATRGAIVDCRALTGATYQNASQLLNAIGQSRTNSPLPMGGLLMRSWDGFPAEHGASSSGYQTGTTILSQGVIEPSPIAAITSPLVFIVDASADDFVPMFASLQAVGKARVVTTAALSGGELETPLAGLHLTISRGIYVYPNGAVGFHADATASPRDALQVAMAQLSAPSNAAPAPSGSAAPAGFRHYSGADNPPLEQRLLALFRFWGAIEYFYPYTNLMDRPWDGALEEYIPMFMAANTRAAYEDALMRLAARMNDSHSAVAGRVATLGAPRGDVPGIRVRYIEGRMAVVSVIDPFLHGHIAPGDEIVAVNGEPIAHVEARLRPIVTASTPQAAKLLTARFAMIGPPGSIVTIQLRGGDGRVRTVQATRRPSYPPNSSPSWRILEGNVGYIDLERLSVTDSDRALNELMNTRALILDLRAYPQGTAWTLVPRFTADETPVTAAQFRRRVYSGPPWGFQQNWTSFAQQIPQRPDVPHYHHPIYVLINERAISQAEHTCLFLESAAHVTFVGEPTNGANGDVTTVALPGGLWVYFTGHDVRHADGRQLQRVGIRPDVPVAPTLAGLRAGRDEVLEAALTLARQ